MAGKLGHLMTRLHLARSRASSPSAAAASVPRGHLAVYVGEGRKRLVVPTACLSHPAFVTLLKRVEDEFGFDLAASYCLTFVLYGLNVFETETIDMDVIYMCYVVYGLFEYVCTVRYMIYVRISFAHFLFFQHD